MSNDAKSWYRCKAAEDGVAEVEIYDEIGFWGISAKDFIRDWKALEQGAEEIVLRVNSPGGEVFDGLAIYNRIKASDKPVTAVVDGLAASMASVIIMAADNIIVPAGAYLMIHNPWGGIVGDFREMEKEADFLRKLQETLAGIYAARTGRTDEEIIEMMNAETWMDGEEAESRGFADMVEDRMQAAALLPIDRMESVPEEVRAVAKERREKMELETLESSVLALQEREKELEGKIEELTTAMAKEAEARDAAYEAGVVAGEDQLGGKIQMRLEKYVDATFVLSHMDKSDEEIAEAWAAIEWEEEEEAVDADESGDSPDENAPAAFDYSARVKELKAEGKSAYDAHRIAKREQAAS